MKHNHHKEERQNTQTKKAHINDKIAIKKGHQQERRPNAPQKTNDMNKKTPHFRKTLRITFQQEYWNTICTRKWSPSRERETQKT